jgi:hypothetical protein
VPGGGAAAVAASRPGAAPPLQQAPPRSGKAPASVDAQYQEFMATMMELGAL